MRLARFDQEVVLPFRFVTALAFALAAACTTVSPVDAGTSCGPSGYAYAGIQPAQVGYGISVKLASLASPVVQSGHVAGWVGVGGPGQGPGGSDEWLQVGLNSLPGTANTLYYEIMRPGTGQTYAEVDTHVPNGKTLRLAVLETATVPGAWRVWVNGRPVTPPIALAGSHGALAPMAMGESWDGGRPACNRFEYRFADVSIAASPGGSWAAARDATVLQDPGYKVVKRAAASFDAASNVAPPAPAPKPAPAPAAAPQANTESPAKQSSSSTVRVMSASAISADSPLRKGFLPAPSQAAILGVTQQPAPAATATPSPAPAATATPSPVPAPDAPVQAAADAGVGASVPGAQSE